MAKPMAAKEKNTPNHRANALALAISSPIG
jgi:hypothetical protein